VARLAGIKAQMVRTVLGAQIRVDDQRMKRKTMDYLPELLAKIEKERKRLALETSSIPGIL
jgi:hypothetical protein